MFIEQFLYGTVKRASQVVQLHTFTVHAGKVTYVQLQINFTTAMLTLMRGRARGNKKIRRIKQMIRLFHFIILTAARAVENENKKNDNDDPSKSIVFEEVTQTSHNKPPSLSAFFD